jgi:hypothetical protein
MGSAGRLSTAFVDEDTARAAEAGWDEESFHIVTAIAATRTNVKMAIWFTLDLLESAGLAVLPFDMRLLQQATIADAPHCSDANTVKVMADLAEG